MSFGVSDAYVFGKPETPEIPEAYTAKEPVKELDKLGQLHQRVLKVKEAQNKAEQESAKKLNAEWEKLFADIWTLSIYMYDTFGTNAVPIPAYILRDKNDRKQDVQLCLVPDKDPIGDGELDRIYVMRWNSNNHSSDFFIVEDVLAAEPTRDTAYYAYKEDVRILHTEGRNLPKHRDAVTKIIHNLCAMWEERYRQETEDLVAKLMEEYISEYGNEREER